MLKTFSRLRVDDEFGRVIPEVKHWYWPKWRLIRDLDYPDVPGDYDPAYEYGSQGFMLLSSAVGRHSFYKGWNYLGHGYFHSYEPTIRQRFRDFFSGPVGMTGPMGMMGKNGERGRSASDCQCPRCLVWRTDTKKPQLFLEVLAKGLYLYKCANCNTKSKWRIIDGLMIQADKVKFRAKQNSLHIKDRT